MPIKIETLRAAAIRQASHFAKSFGETKTLNERTAFLCHSHHDANLAKGLVQLLSESGWRIYIDWADTAMPDTPNRQTAKLIKQKIEELQYFLYLATPRSMASRWCPWEIGYADGKKLLDRILIIPTADETQTHGSEYLQLYRRIDWSSKNQLAVWQPGESDSGVLVKDLW